LATPLQTFTCWLPKSVWVQRLGRKVGFMPMLFFGQFDIPFAPGKPAHYLTVLGTPIPTKKAAEPSPEVRVR